MGAAVSFQVEVVGGAEVVAHLGQVGAMVQQFVAAAVERAGYAVQARAEQKLSGEVLKVRTGRLRRSINTQVVNSPTEATAQVGTNIEYAAIHEYGFDGIEQVREYTRHSVVRFRATREAIAHDIETRKAIMFGTGRRASAYALAPGTVRAHERHMVMPERSYLRSSLQELAPSITEWLHEAVAQGIAQ